SHGEVQTIVKELKDLLVGMDAGYQRQFGQQIGFAPHFLLQTKVAINKLENNYDEAVVHSCETPIRASAKSAADLHGLMNSLLTRLREKQLEEAQNVSQKILEETKNLNKLQQELLATMYNSPKKQLLAEQVELGDSQVDLLSAAVSGGTS